MTNSAPLESLCAAAGIRLCRKVSDPTFDAILPIIRGLLAMRRAGLLHSVTVNEFRLSMQFNQRERSQPVTWHQAELLVSKFRSMQ